MDLRKVKKLIELVEESGIAELEVTSGDESVRIAMGGAMRATTDRVPQVVTADMPAPSVVQSRTAEGTQVRAPMAGTFYRAPNPEADPYIELGQAVQAGDVICIIESMKMMHEIRAEQGGIVAHLPVANGQPISTGDVIAVLS